MARSWYNLSGASGKATLSIYDEIGGWGVSAKQLAADLSAMGDVDELDVRIHSPGGDVLEGAAIFNILKAHKARKIVHVDGMALSMASVIAMAGDRIVMPKNALMMIHNPWTMTAGDADQLRKDADLLDKMKGQLISAYSRTKKTPEEIAALMDAETWMDGDEAVAAGFADETSAPILAAAKVDVSKFARVDARALALMEVRNESKPADDAAAGAAVEPVELCADRENADVTAAYDAGFEAGRKAERAAIDDSLGQATANVAKLAGDMKDRDAALATARAEAADLAAKLAAVKADLDAERAGHAAWQAKHANMLAAVALVPEVTWPDALAKCANDYAKARAKYPAAWAAWMHAKTNHK